MPPTKLTEADHKKFQALKEWYNKRCGEAIEGEHFLSPQGQHYRLLLTMMREDIEEAERFMQTLGPGAHTTRNRLNRWYRLFIEEPSQSASPTLTGYIAATAMLNNPELLDPTF